MHLKKTKKTHSYLRQRKEWKELVLSPYCNTVNSGMVNLFILEDTPRSY